MSGPSHTNTICCSPMDMALENMGDRGMSVVLISVYNNPVFEFQSRGIPMSDVEEFVARCQAGPLMRGKMNILMTHCFKFCPWCGADLDQWLRTHPTQAAELLERSRPYWVSVA